MILHGPSFSSDFLEKTENDLISDLYTSSLNHYNEKTSLNANIAYPVIRDVYQRPDNKFERIVVPFTDGVKSLNVVTNLKEAYETEGKSLIDDFERNITLALIDNAWKIHLRKMDELKQSVQLAVHEQKDPLLIYKFEAFELFKAMLNSLNKEVLSFLIKGGLPNQKEANIQEAKRITSKQKLKTSKDDVLNTEELAQKARSVGAGASQSPRQTIETIVRDQPKIGRNEKVTIKNITTGEGGAILTNNINYEKKAKALAKVAEKQKGAFSFLLKANKANQFYFYNPKLVVLGQQEFLSVWGNRPNSDNWALAAAINPVIEENQVSLEQYETIKKESFFIEKPESYVNALPKSIESIDSIVGINQNAYLQLGMIYKESFKNNKLAENRLTHLLDLGPPANLAAPSLYHLYKINEKILPSKAKQYFDRILTEYPDTAYGQVLANSENFDRSTLNTPEQMYNSLLKLYESRDYDALKKKASALFVFLNGTEYQPKFELLLANTKGRLQGMSQWENALTVIETKYPGTPEAELAKEMINQIKMTDIIDEQNKTYINYKWIFTYRIQDSIELKTTKNQLQKSLYESEISNWFLTEDRFDDTHTFLVLHGIRNIRRLNEWKKKINDEEQQVYKKNNFVVLSSDYKKMIRNKKLLFDEK